MMRRIVAVPLFAILASTPVLAQERHPATENSWWINVSSFFAERDFKASANANFGGVKREFDFERDLDLDETFDWQGNTYDVGVRVDASTNVDITRVFFARRFRDNGPHSLRLGAGIHWLDISAQISGQAALDGQRQSRLAVSQHRQLFRSYWERIGRS